MAKINGIDGLEVFSTTSNGSNKSAVRVRKHGTLAGCVYVDQRSPLKYLKLHPNSNYKKQLVHQLQVFGLSEGEIVAIFEG